MADSANMFARAVAQLSLKICARKSMCGIAASILLLPGHGLILPGMVKNHDWHVWTNHDDFFSQSSVS